MSTIENNQELENINEKDLIEHEKDENEEEFMKKKRKRSSENILENKISEKLEKEKEIGETIVVNDAFNLTEEDKRKCKKICNILLFNFEWKINPIFFSKFLKIFHKFLLNSNLQL
jgi:hypothetical protein